MKYAVTITVTLLFWAAAWVTKQLGFHVLPMMLFFGGAAVLALSGIESIVKDAVREGVIEAHKEMREDELE
jgi:hypothetical protein